MARNRIIKPDFWADEKIGKLSPMSRLLFIGIWNFCDDIGVCRGTSGYLRSQIFQFDDISIKQVDGLMSELTKNNLIITKKINDETFTLVKNFLKHQKIDKPSLFRFIDSTTKHNVLELFNSSSVDVSTRSRVDAEYNENENENENVESTGEQSPITVVDKSQNEITLDKIAKIWNNMAEQCNVPKTKLTELVANKLKKRFLEAKKAFPSVEDWQRIVEAVPYDSFRLGQNERKWRAEFVWLFQDHGSKKIPNYCCLMTEWDFHNGEEKND